jgi:hypothetical protein
VEAQWENMSLEDKMVVQEQLEEIQKRDWKGLSIDEKKAGTTFASPCTSQQTLYPQHTTYLLDRMVPGRLQANRGTMSKYFSRFLV